MVKKIETTKQQLIESPKNRRQFSEEFEVNCNKLKATDKIQKIGQCIEYLLNNGGLPFKGTLYNDKNTEKETYDWLFKKATVIEADAKAQEAIMEEDKAIEKEQQKSKEAIGLAMTFKGIIIDPFNGDELSKSCFDKGSLKEENIGKLRVALEELKSCIPMNKVAFDFSKEYERCNEAMNNTSCLLCKLDPIFPGVVLAYPLDHEGVTTGVDGSAIDVGGKCSYARVQEELVED
jgi:hypothetical protein